VPAYALVGLVLAHAERTLGAEATLVGLDRMKLTRGIGPGEPVTSELAPVGGAPAQGAVVKVRATLSTSGGEIGMVALSLRVGA